MKKKIAFLFLALFLFFVGIATIKPVFGAQLGSIKRRFLKVLVMNDESQAIPVLVQNQEEPGPAPQVQKWEHWYQCHPNPTNEAEIRGYLNDRGRDGWEVVAAAGPGSLICEYYKRPLRE